ncbi:MAG: MgtC/SapB family protein [Gammaproteobacteria bacterium]
MDLTSFSVNLEVVMRVLIACLLGGMIGWERERHGISAGIRTYSAIALGACVFGILSMAGGPSSDTTRIAGQVVTGIGFLGGGLIFREGNYVTGLTTAATLWATASVGLAISFGFYTIGTLTAVIIFLLLYLPKLRWWKKISAKVPKPNKDLA